MDEKGVREKSRKYFNCRVKFRIFGIFAFVCRSRFEDVSVEFFFFQRVTNRGILVFKLIETLFRYLKIVLKKN